ncbi:Dabb family protein [Pontibacter russatus]|uniref:Dabb family protein n=1 Tax=Pontibacter russatus TaxID=2694929 RepID=UPI00137A3343|nr:Dabb family protein [Pontibacter russatus]
MKHLKITLLLVMLLGVSPFLLLSAGASKAQKLRHAVAFKFKPEVTPEQMKKATEDFHALKGKVPQILEFEGGPDVAFQKKRGGFTHCFIVTVRDEEALAAYGAHPDHQAFSKSVDPLLAEVMVVDYWAE